MGWGGGLSFSSVSPSLSGGKQFSASSQPCGCILCPHEVQPPLSQFWLPSSPSLTIRLLSGSLGVVLSVAWEWVKAAILKLSLIPRSQRPGKSCSSALTGLLVTLILPPLQPATRAFGRNLASGGGREDRVTGKHGERAKFTSSQTCPRPARTTLGETAGFMHFGVKGISR